MPIPQKVLDLAATVKGGTPMAWHEYDDHWTIIMQDGRKYTFGKDKLAHQADPIHNARHKNRPDDAG